MTTYFRQILSLLFKLLIIIVLYSLGRFFFFLVNQQAFGTNSGAELFNIFFYGIRFDYSAIIQYNLLFIFLYLLPFNFVYHKNFKRWVGFFFYLVNFFLLLLNFTDAEYFKYTGKRSTADLFYYMFMSDDVIVLIPQFIRDFWYIGLIWLVCITGCILLINRIKFNSASFHRFSVKSWIMASILYITVPSILFIGARGTGLKPIMIISAGRYTTTQNIPLLLNTPFCILHSLKEGAVRPMVYFDKIKLSKLYNPEQQIQPKHSKRIDNIVIIILESFSREFVGALNGNKGYTPCLDSIINQGLVFENAFANGKRSIEAVPAILAGLPALSDDSYITSRFSGNKLLGLPAILAKEGYHTSFFHGGRNGTMGFDEFSRISGIQHYYGLNEYQGPEAFDGTWGINDEEFLQYYATKLNSLPQPFFSCVFTLSSHHPYKVPDKYKDRFNQAPNKLIRSICYADYALGKFFRIISSQPWYQNTLFIFTADHTAAEQSKLAVTRAGIFRIPIIYYHPGDTLLRGRSKRVTQQTDIMPSVLDYVGIKTPFVAFGTSVFSDTSNNFATNYLGGIYQYFKGDYMLMFDGYKSTAMYNYNKDRLLKSNLLKLSPDMGATMELHFKAIIQQYNSRLLNNTMIVNN
jgi:phosphoglycerol transferase MdoB-like AlkP superfamily enzyme